MQDVSTVKGAAGHPAVITDKPPIKICKPQESLELQSHTGLDPLPNRPNLPLVHLDLSPGDDAPEEGRCVGVKITLLSLHEQTVLQ